MLVSAIVPAYNEEKTVSDVLRVLKNVKDINEIILVNDGSRDGTASAARECGVEVIEHSENKGKGAAIKSGLLSARGEVILFLDADLIGLKEKHIESLLAPVLRNEAEMTVGVFSGGRLSTDLAQKISPYLSGQRAVRKSVFDKMNYLESTGYGLEIALTLHAEKEHIKVKEVELENLTHVMKEEKLGFVRGVGHRAIMYWQIYKGMRLAKR